MELGWVHRAARWGYRINGGAFTPRTGLPPPQAQALPAGHHRALGAAGEGPQAAGGRPLAGLGGRGCAAPSRGDFSTDTYSLKAKK